MSSILNDASSSYVTGGAASYHPEQMGEVSAWNKGKFLPRSSLAPCEAVSLSEELGKIEAAVAGAYDELTRLYDEIQFGNEVKDATTRLSKARSTLFEHAANLQGKLGIYERVATVRELTALPQLIGRVQSVAITVLLAITKAIDVDAVVGEKWTNEFAYFRGAIPKLFGDKVNSTAHDIGQQCDVFSAELEHKEQNPIQNQDEQNKLDMRKALYYQMLELVVSILEAKKSPFAANLSETRKLFCDEEHLDADLLKEDDLKSDAPLLQHYAFRRNTFNNKPTKDSLLVLEKIERSVAKNICGLLRDQTTAVKALCGPKRPEIEPMWNERCITTLHQMLIREFKVLCTQEQVDPTISRIVDYIYGLFCALESARTLSALTFSLTRDSTPKIFGFLKQFSDFIEALPRYTTELEKLEKLYTLIMQFCPEQPSSKQIDRLHALYEYIEGLSHEPKTSASQSPKGYADHFVWRTQDYMREILAKKIPELVALSDEEKKVPSELLQSQLVYATANESRQALPSRVTSALVKQLLAALFLKGDAPHNTLLEIEFYKLNKQFGGQLENTLSWFPETKKIFEAYEVELDNSQVKAAANIATLACEAGQEEASVSTYAEAWHYYFAYQRAYGADNTLRGFLDAAKGKHPHVYPKVIEDVITTDITTWNVDYATGFLQLLTAKGRDANDGYLLRLVAAALYGNQEDEIYAQKQLNCLLKYPTYQGLREGLGKSIRTLIAENAIKKLCISAKLQPSDYEKTVLDEQEPSDRLSLARDRIQQQHPDINVVYKDK